MIDFPFTFDSRMNVREVAMVRSTRDCASFTFSRGIMRKMGNPRWVRPVLIDDGEWEGFLVIQPCKYEYEAFAVLPDRNLPEISSRRQIGVSPRRINVSPPSEPVGIPYQIHGKNLILDVREFKRQDINLIKHQKEERVLH